MKIEFEKWQGLGNDFIILKNAAATAELAKKLCSRKFGIGADGIFSAKKSDVADIGWDFYNSDGSAAQMCGNGIRCFALYALEHGLVDKKKFSVETLAGIIVPEILEDGNVRVDMGKPVFEAAKIPVNVPDAANFEVEGFKAMAVSMGNPHCIIFDNNDTSMLARVFGPKIEAAPIFPEKTNVEFVKVLDRNTIKVDVWERGCGITLACGTGSCAAVVAGVLKGLLDERAEVRLGGGKLYIEYKIGENVFMEGAATHVFEGVLEA